MFAVLTLFGISCFGVRAYGTPVENWRCHTRGGSDTFVIFCRDGFLFVLLLGGGRLPFVNVGSLLFRSVGLVLGVLLRLLVGLLGSAFNRLAKFLNAWQAVEVLQAEYLEEPPRRAVEHGSAYDFSAADDLDQVLVE